MVEPREWLIWVLRALDDAGISFDMMSGTSAGAMAGIIYASGLDPWLAAQHFQHDLTPSRAFRCLPGWPNLYLLTQFRRRAWDRMLRVYLHDWRLEQLPIEFLSLTVDLVQSRSVVRVSGDAVQAILESINLPGHLESDFAGWHGACRWRHARQPTSRCIGQQWL